MIVRARLRPKVSRPASTKTPMMAHTRRIIGNVNFLTAYLDGEVVFK